MQRRRKPEAQRPEPLEPLPQQQNRVNRLRLRPSSRILLGWLLIACAGLLRADQPLPPELEGIGIEEHLGHPVDLNLQFTAENGYPVPLSQFFKQGRPVILNLVYYTCPQLCSLVLNAETKALKDFPWTIGKEFEVVTISINPDEGFNLAREKKASYLDEYGRSTEGWHFLTDYKGNVKRLADQVGFRYRWDERQKQFMHTAAIMVLTPDGKMSRYLYGIRFPQRDLRLALTEASEYKLGNTIEKIVLFCYHYDPESKSYVLFAKNVMKIGGALTILAIGLFIGRLLREERQKPPAAPTETQTV